MLPQVTEAASCEHSPSYRVNEAASGAKMIVGDQLLSDLWTLSINTVVLRFYRIYCAGQ